ncbi:MAG: D-2-hydroxyacid dehydrogenase [Halobacteriota archaeon]
MAIERLCIHRSVEAVFPPERLEAALGDLDLEIVISDGPPAEDCDAVVTFEDRAWFTDVDWLQSILAGVDRYAIDDLEAAGVVVTNATGIHGNAVGQTVAGYVLSFARRLHRYRDFQRQRTWRQLTVDDMFTVDGERLCVVGLGTLGRGIVEYATGLGLEVVGVRKSGEPVDGVVAVHPPGDLPEAIADARFVALAVPLTDETTGLFGTEEFRAMRSDAYLVNVSRGPVVDEAALIRALRGGEIAGAALDVYDREPLPGDSPLWDRDDVLMTPHVSALFPTYHAAVAEIVRENLERLSTGEELVNQVV